MALILPNRYPGRWDPASVDYPQGKFKNRSAPGAKDGSYAERDWANDQLAFFGALLNNAGIVPNGTVDTAQVSQLYNALMTVTGAGTAQFAPYDATRTYQTGETCTTIVGGELKIWQMYAGPSMTSTGNDPDDPSNRHDGWLSTVAPFWWIEYGNIPGRPSYWLSESAPERAVMEIGQNLPTAVYWRLAQQFPALVSGLNINTGDIRGEFLRVWDGGRGIDTGRLINTSQLDDNKSHSHIESQAVDIVSPGRYGNTTVSNTGQRSEGYGDAPTVSTLAPFTSTSGGSESRPRNMARSMIIEI